MNPVTIAAFHDELEKIAVSARGLGRITQWVKGLATKGGGGLKRQWHGVVGGDALLPSVKGSLPDESLAGALKGLRHPGKHLKERWGEMGTGHQAMFAGMQGMQIPEIANRKGKDRSGAIGSALGSGLGWVALNRVPLVGQLAGSLGAEYLGSKLGRGAGHLLGQR